MFIEAPKKASLREREKEHVVEYFHKTRDEEIQSMMPGSAESAEVALAMYEESLKKDAASYGRTIYCEEKYIGDIWCYGLDTQNEPNAMLSYCIFEKEYWNKGIATIAVDMFMKELTQKFRIKSIGAFLYADNMGSRRVLEKNGFVLREKLMEDGRISFYYEMLLDNEGVRQD